MNPGNSELPIRVKVVRTLTYRGRVESFSSLSTLFQGLCATLKQGGCLQGVYDELALVKKRILTQGQPLGIDDVGVLVSAHHARLGQTDPLVLGEPLVVITVPSSGEQLGFHRELVRNLKLPKPIFTLNEVCLQEILGTVLHPRHFLATELEGLLSMTFPQQDGLNVRRILDTVYKATFSRTIRKDRCDPKIAFPLPEKGYHFILDTQRSAQLTLTARQLLRHLLFRLYHTPDLAPALDSDEQAKARIQDGQRLLMGALNDAIDLPRKRMEIESILRARRTAEASEELEEL